MYSPEIQSKIAIWNQKAIDGTLSLEETKEAIILMRGDRMAARQAAASSSRRVTKAKAEIKHADEMLDELGELE